MLPGTRPPRAALAVLPFSNHTREDEFAHFADAFSTELAATLRRLPGIRVAPSASSMAFGARRAMDEIARALNVGAIVDGQVRRSGGQLAIAVDLVRVPDGERLWGQRFNRPTRDAFTLQGEIASGVARALHVSPPVLPQAPSLEAYDLYLRARTAAGTSRSALERALEYFERALALAPDFTAAHAGLASTAVALIVYGYVPAPGIAPRARSAATRAIEADPTCIEARVARAMLALFVDWTPGAAHADLLAAQSAEPDSPEVSRSLAWHAALTGDVSTATAAAGHAVALDPLSAVSHITQSTIGTALRRGDDARRAAMKAIELAPSSFMAHRALAAAEVLDGNVDAARPELDQATLLSRRHQWCVAELAVVCSRLGDRAAADALHEELMRRSTTEYVQRHVLALTSAALGRSSDAAALLEQARRLREPLPFLRLWPYFDGLQLSVF